MTLAEFFHMGGYALYVWGSYGLTFVVLTGNILVPWMSNRRQRRELAGRLKRMEHS